MTIRTLATATLLLVAPALSACYESALPLGPPERATIDPAFIGTWTCVDPKDAANTATVTSLPFDAHQYYVDWREAPDHVTRYRAYATRLGAETLWNVEELDTKPGQRGFVFIRARITADNGLAIALVEESALKGLTGVDALREITRRVQDPTLVGPFATCTPKAPPAPQ